MRVAVVVALLLVLGGLALTVVGTNAAPLSHSCADDLDVTACEGALGAVLRRGLPDLHPLILSAHVEAGPAPGPEDLGHRATVAFDLLGVPGSTSIDLYYDRGGHWGGESDRADSEIRAWSLAPLAVGVSLAAVVLGVAWRRRSRTTG